MCVCDSGCERELLQCGSGKYHKKMGLPCCKGALHWLILYLHSICIIYHSLFIQFVAFAAAVSSRMHSAVLAKRKIKAYACVCQCVRCADFSLPAWKYAMNKSALIIEALWRSLNSLSRSPFSSFPLLLLLLLLENWCHKCKWQIYQASKMSVKKQQQQQQQRSPY